VKPWAVKIANEISKRDNIEKFGAVVGNVLSIDPVKIGIEDNAIILDSTNFYICSSLAENFTKSATMEINDCTLNVSATDSRGDTITSVNVSKKADYNTKITFKDILKKDDKVLVIASEDNQTFFIVDKLLRWE